MPGIPPILTATTETMEDTDMTLKTVLANKAPGYVAVPPEMKISGVISLLAEKRIGAVLLLWCSRFVQALWRLDSHRTMEGCLRGQRS